MTKYVADWISVNNNVGDSETRSSVEANVGTELELRHRGYRRAAAVVPAGNITHIRAQVPRQ